MDERDRNRPIPLTPEGVAIAELTASQQKLSKSLTRQVDFLVKQLNLSPDDAASRVREKPYFAPEDQEAEQIAWFQIATLMEQEPERGTALWQRIKADATTELATAARSAESIEPKVNARPWDRARLSAIVTALTKSMVPRDALEELLIHQMACAYEMHLKWQGRAAWYLEEDAFQAERDRKRLVENMSSRERERYELDQGWMPSRVSQAEAIDQAVMIADRYQRSFLRLLKAFRDMRRLVGTVVLAGGQLNIAEQQIVNRHPVTAKQTGRSARPKPSPKARRVTIVRKG